MEEQDRVGWWNSHLGEAGQVGNATSVVLIPGHEDIAFVSPVFSPKDDKEKNQLSRKAVSIRLSTENNDSKTTHR